MGYWRRNGGNNHIVYSGQSCIVGGLSNEIHGTRSAIVAGSYNYNSGLHSVVVGGTDHTLSHDRSVIIGGTGMTSLATDTVYAPKIETFEDGEGIIMSSPNGTRYKVTVTNTGAIDVSAA